MEFNLKSNFKVAALAITCQNNGVGILNSITKVYTCQCVDNYYGQNCQYQPLNSTTFINSTILTQELGVSLMNLIGVPLNSVATRIYQGSTHGFASANFHSKVDGINGTLTVIKSTTGNIFGGFTMINWGLSATYYTDPSAFIFSLVNKMNYSSLAQNNKQPIANSVYTNPQYGPTFGGGHDIHVADQSNLHMNSYTNFGHTYALNNLTLFNSWNLTIQKSFLAGGYNFQTVEIEVYASKYIFILITV